MAKTCIHIIKMEEFSPEVCEITLPLINQYANKIGASVNVIGSKRKYPQLPDSYERFQVYEDGHSFEWNIVLDANMLLGPKLEDITQNARRDHVGLFMAFAASQVSGVNNRFFNRDGRNLAPVQALLLSSDWTHDLWEPFRGDTNSLLSLTRRADGVAEYVLAYNMAKFGLKANGLFNSTAQVLRLNPPDRSSTTALSMAKNQLKAWGCHELL